MRPLRMDTMWQIYSQKANRCQQWDSAAWYAGLYTEPETTRMMNVLGILVEAVKMLSSSIEGISQHPLKLGSVRK